jgi:hypothetical protein
MDNLRPASHCSSHRHDTLNPVTLNWHLTQGPKSHCLVPDPRDVPQPFRDNLYTSCLAARDWIFSSLWCPYAQDVEVSNDTNSSLQCFTKYKYNEYKCTWKMKSLTLFSTLFVDLSQYLLFINPCFYFLRKRICKCWSWHVDSEAIIYELIGGSLLSQKVTVLQPKTLMNGPFWKVQRESFHWEKSNFLEVIIIDFLKDPTLCNHSLLTAE